MKERLIVPLEVTREVDDSPYQPSLRAVGISLRVTQGPEWKCHRIGLLTNCSQPRNKQPESESTLSFNMLTVL